MRRCTHTAINKSSWLVVSSKISTQKSPSRVVRYPLEGAMLEEIPVQFKVASEVVPSVLTGLLYLIKNYTKSKGAAWTGRNILSIIQILLGNHV